MSALLAAVAAVLLADFAWIVAWDAWNTDRNWGRPLAERES